MCGIAGIITDQQQNLIPLLEKMIAALSHRGPDDEGIWIAANRQLFLGHKRLSIIDLSSRAKQPMVSFDGRFVVIFNGEIYNYLELRELCLKKGSQFNTHSDTEVIMECYRHWGNKAFCLFNGMWALALYDVQKNQVILCRDPFAIKPLYYAYKQGCWYFASEIKALRILHENFNQVDDLTVKLFLEHGYLEREQWTFFKNIRRFPHANYALIDLQRITPSL